MISWDSVPEEQDNQSFGTKSCIKIEGLVQSDTGIYIGDPEEANRHNTQLNHASPKKDILLTGFKCKLQIKFVLRPL